jgi:hypothetical protein
MGMTIDDFEMSKSCVTCKYHLFDEVYEHFYCLLKKQNIDYSEHSEWESDEQEVIEDGNFD